jgi:hypothetical protein
MLSSAFLVRIFCNLLVTIRLLSDFGRGNGIDSFADLLAFNT